MDSKGEEIENTEDPRDIDQEKVASNAEGGDKDGSTIGDDEMPQGSTADEDDSSRPQSEQTAQAQGEEETPVKNKEEEGEEVPAENSVSPAEDENIAEDASSKQEGVEEPPVTEEKPPAKSPTPEGDETATTQANKGTESDPVPVVPASDTKEADGGEQQGEEGEEEEERSYEYNYDSMYSRPTVIEMEDNTLQLLHSFGYECQKRSNLIALDHLNLMYAAGNVLVLFDLMTRKYTHLRTLGGGGIGAITLHPSREYFAVGEKGDNPVIAIYCYPSLKLYRILREGTEQQYSHMDFNPREGDLLASVGGYPDYMLTVWKWESESIVLRTKAFSQDIYRVSFSPELPGQLTTSGTGHIRFWKMALTFTGLKLQGYLGKFGKTELTDIAAYVELPDGKVLSGSEWGNMLLWDGGFIKVELAKKGKKFCHNGVIEVLYLDEGEVVSAGADGFIRIWNFESIDNADANENNIPYEIEPLTEIKVGSDVSLKSLCRSNDPDMPTIWYGQDANGALWKLDIVASHTRKPSEKLVTYHSGEVCSIDCSPDAHLAGSMGEDGSVRVCQFESSEILCHVKYPGGGSSLIWAPLSVDSSGLTLVAGFTDGVVRILKIDKDSLVSKSSHRKGVPGGKLILVNVSKPHTRPVTAMAIDHEGKLLATASDDSTVFFINLKKEFLPIGYVKVPAPVSCITWSQPNQGLLRLLVCCKDGSMAEVSAPIGEYDTSQSYHLESVSVSSRTFVSIKDRLRKEEADAIKEAEMERKRKIKEAAKKARREKRKAEMGDSYRSEDEEEEEEEGETQGEEEEQEDEKKDKSDGPSSILSVFYEHGEPNNFWISVGGYDAGYLYRGSLEGSEDTNEPYETPHTVPVPTLNDKDIPIHSMMFNKTGEYLLTGTEDGCVRVYRLYSPYSLTTLDRHWTLRIHDNHYGQVKTMSLSYDNQYLVTGGADGNMFIHKAELPPASKYARLDTKLTPGTQVLHEPKDPIRDINDTSHYSIEDAKRKAEHDRMMKAADEKKQQVRREISKLRREFTQLQQRSTRLPAHLRLGQKEFVMDPSMSEQLQQQLLDKVELVRREMAWDSEKEQIALDKLKTRYKDCIECDRIVVYGVRNRQNVTSFRTAFPSAQFLEIMEKVSSTEVNLTPWTAQGSDQKGPSRRNTKHVLETGTKPDQLLEETDERKELTKSEARRLKKEKRKREWEELNKIKPGDNFEDPREVEAIEKAKREMGDYKLKSSSDFVVSEDQRTSTDKKRKELVLCRNTILETKRSFNSKLKFLRDEKLTMIDKIKELVKQLREKQKKLPLVMRKTIPRVPKINPEEVPEREFEYTKDTLLKFKADLEKREAAEKQAQAGGEEFGGFGGFGGDQQEGDEGEEEEEEGEQETVSGSSSTLHSSSINASTREDQSTMSDMERLMASEQEMTLLYQQDCILREVDRLIEEFDERVLHLRHDRSLEEIKIKSAEIKHLTQFEEMELLKEFEKRESTFTSKYRAKKQEKADLEVKIEEAEWSVKEKESLYQNLTEQQKALDQSVTESVGENNKFKEFLMKVYRKKIKRAKLKAHQDTGEEGGDNGEDEEEEESDSDSDWSSEDESDEEGFDDSVCPPGCDQTLFDLAIDMREKRMDLEELLAEEKKSLDGVKRELDSFTKKAKTIDAHVKTALQELQAFQLKKQQRINELDAVVVLKLHQILHYQQGGAPPTNVAQCLVFPASAREHLANRIGELVHEKQHEKKRYRELRQHHVRLVRERKEMEKKVAILNEKANETMRLKFGRIVNLDALEGLTTNKMIGELEESLQTEQMKHDIAMATVEGRINNTRQELLSIVRKNTNKTTKLHSLTTRSRQLEHGLNMRQRSTEGSEASSYNPFEPEEKARLLQIVQIQNQEIQALRDEIKILSLKGGKLLPPPQAPGAMAESTLV